MAVVGHDETGPVVEAGCGSSTARGQQRQGVAQITLAARPQAGGPGPQDQGGEPQARVGRGWGSTDPTSTGVT